MIFDKITLSYLTAPVALPDNSPIEFPLGDMIDDSSYTLRSVDGLGPPPIDLYINDQIMEGGDYQGRRPQRRDIVMLIGLKPKYYNGETIDQLRSALYNWITPKYGLPVTLSLYNGATKLAYAAGQVKSIEPNIFSKDPQVQITFSCFGSYLDTDPVVVPNFSTMSQNPLTFTNPGDAPCGFRMSMKFTLASGFYGDVTVSDTFSEFIKFNRNLYNNDIVTFDTKSGQRSATLYIASSGTTIDILRYLSYDSTWLQLHRGINFLQINKSVTLLDFTLYPRFWGV